MFLGVLAMFYFLPLNVVEGIKKIKLATQFS